MTNLAEAIQNACEIARQDERRKFKEILTQKKVKLQNERAGLFFAMAQVGKIVCVDELLDKLSEEEALSIKSTEKEFVKLENTLRKEMEDSAKRYMEEMMGTVSESIKTEWREFSYIASELHKRKIETIIDRERGDIQLRDEATGKTVVFGSLSEVKAFALGLDWGVKNAKDMAFRGLHSPICKEEWK